MATSNVSVSVGPVTVPAIVDRPQIVSTMGPNQVQLEEFDRWALPLQSGIAIAVAENLKGLLGTSKVILSSQATDLNAEYRAVIEVQRFESFPGEAAALDAVWTVRRIQNGREKEGRTTQRERAQGQGYDAIAAAHSRALVQLSRDIASAVRELSHTGP